MPNGYGQIHSSGKTVYAHRVAYELQHGPIPDGMFILHKCDNRKCVNHEHLFLGTFDDNMNDMVSKQRQAHGTKNGHAKLNSELVREIRQAIGPQAKIAGQFNVSQSLVSLIKSERIWRHV